MHYHGHRERLRGRLQETPAQLADYEILELLLGNILLRQDTKPLAKELLERFQSIRGVLDAKPAELRSVKGFGPSLENYWILLRELMCRHAESPLRRHEILASPLEVARMARLRLAGCPHEENWVAYVDTQNRLLVWEKANKGSIDQTVVYPRDIMEKAISIKASGFILVHNHPGGNAQPSKADIATTAMLKENTRTISLRFIDHILITDDVCISIVENRVLA